MSGTAAPGTLVSAAVVRGPDTPPRLEEIRLHPPGPGQVQVRVAAVGVCHSDLSLARGTLRQQYPAVLGHEASGHVVAVGTGVRSVRAGDPVVLNWSPACRECWYCQHGEPYLCERSDDAAGQPYATLGDGTEVFPGLGIGAFGAETVVGETACLPLPDGVPLAEAALLGCAVLTGIGAVRKAAGVRPGDSVAVIGLGGVGLSALQGARIAGADPVLAVDPAPEKAELARRLGATEVLLPGPDLGRRIRALTGGRGVDHAIECVGRADTIRAAWSATRRGGRAVVLGLGSATDPVTFSALEISHFARALIGCRYGDSDPATDLPALAEYVRAGRLDLAALGTDHIGLDGLGAAFDRMAAGKGARSLVHF